MADLRSNIGYEKLTVSNSAVGFASLPAGATRAVIRCETANVRWRGDGEDPTATDGMPLDSGEGITLDRSLSKLRFIRTDASDATLHIAYY